VRRRCSSPPPPSSSWAASRQGATHRRCGNSSKRSVSCMSGARPEEEAPRVCKLWDQSVVLGASEEKSSHCCVGHAASLSSSTRSHRLEVSLLSLSLRMRFQIVDLNVYAYQCLPPCLCLAMSLRKRIR
jgi:hypothetical protein